MIQAVLYKHMTSYLGEAAIWHPGRNSFFWVDLEAGWLYSCSENQQDLQRWQLDAPIGTVVPDESTGLVLALPGSLFRFDPDTGLKEKIVSLDQEPETNRSNDGKCDPSGRLWLGTLALDESEGAGRLYCIPAHGEPEIRIPRATIPNGIVWTRDKTTMYWIDTPTRQILAFGYEDRTGCLGDARVAVQIPPDLGMPDGMTIDSEDMLWVAHWGGSGVYRWDPRSSALLDKIEVPAPNVTSCAFGGTDYRDMIITTARKGLSADALERFPESGSVYYCVPGVKGVPPNQFKL